MQRSKLPAAERRFDGGSWAALSYALAAGLGCLLLVVGAWRTPSDGWLYDGDLYSATPAITFRTNLSGRPSPLRAGDQLIAVKGIALAELADRAHAFYGLRPPQWPAGTTLRYTVLRDATPLTLDVPLYHVAPWTHQLALIRTQGLVAVLQLVSSRRVQALINRRFFRQKYDTRQVLAQFAERAQQDADLDALSADLLATVDETLKPERVTLWLVRR